MMNQLRVSRSPIVLLVILAIAMVAATPRAAAETASGSPNETAPRHRSAAAGRLGLSLHVGVNEPHGTFGEFFAGDLSWGLDLEYRLDARWSIELYYGRHEFSFKPGPGADNLDHLSLNGKRFFGAGPWQPFVNFGAGAYDPGPGSTELGANLGAGVLRDLPGVWDWEAAYSFHRVFISGSELDFSTVSLGVRWRR